MKLVKARLRQDFESEAQCCPDYLNHVKSDYTHQGVITLDLDNSISEEICCSYCYKSFGVVFSVTHVEIGLLVPLHLFDLDEGLLS